MRKTQNGKMIALCLMVLSVLTASCGGGDGSSSAGYVIHGSGSITLAWDAPTENTDESPLTDLAGYKIYYGTSPGLYSESVDVGDVNQTTISNLPPGEWCFASIAYNSSGNESGFSEEVCTYVS